MNGMRRKKLARDHARRFTADGLPRDARDLTEADWRLMHVHLEAMKREIAERHANDDKAKTDGESAPA